MSAQGVGGAVAHTPISIITPCHRVVGTDGSLTGYAGGITSAAVDGIRTDEEVISQMEDLTKEKITSKSQDPTLILHGYDKVSLLPVSQEVMRLFFWTEDDAA